MQATSERALEGWRPKYHTYSFTAKCEKQSFLATAEPFRIRTFSNARKYQFKIVIRGIEYLTLHSPTVEGRHQKRCKQSKEQIYFVTVASPHLVKFHRKRKGCFGHAYNFCPHSNTMLAVGTAHRYPSRLIFICCLAGVPNPILLGKLESS